MPLTAPEGFADGGGFLGASVGSLEPPTFWINLNPEISPAVCFGFYPASTSTKRQSDICWGFPLGAFLLHGRAKRTPGLLIGSGQILVLGVDATVTG